MSTSARILVADDDLFVQRTVRRFLEQTPGVECVGCCSDGAEAVAFVETHAVDIALLDVRMPGTDGFEAARLIGASHPAVRVILWSSFVTEEAVAEARYLGVAGFVRKNCSWPAFTDALRAVRSGFTVVGPGPLGVVPRSAAPHPAGEVPALTDREAEVLADVCLGSTNAEIAAARYLSESSVKATVGSLMAKFDVKTRVKLVVRAHEIGLHRIAPQRTV